MLIEWMPSKNLRSNLWVLPLQLEGAGRRGEVRWMWVVVSMQMHLLPARVVWEEVAPSQFPQGPGGAAGPSSGGPGAVPGPPVGRPLVLDCLSSHHRLALYLPIVPGHPRYGDRDDPNPRTNIQSDQTHVSSFSVFLSIVGINVCSRVMSICRWCGATWRRAG